MNCNLQTTNRAGEGGDDTAALLISRALTGNTGKVEIEGRRYTFSCIPLFRLVDETTGLVHECPDTLQLIRTVVRLRQGARAERSKNSDRPVRVLREMPSIVNQLSSRSSLDASPQGGREAPHLPYSALGPGGRIAGAAAHGGAFAAPTSPGQIDNTPPREGRKA